MYGKFVLIIRLEDDTVEMAQNPVTQADLLRDYSFGNGNLLRISRLKQ